MEKGLSKFIDSDVLTEQQQRVVDFYEEHKSCTRIECAKYIWGSAQPFYLQNLSGIESKLRKKGYLFYTVKGIVVDMTDEKADIQLKLKVQKRMGGAMYGYIMSNIRIFKSATDVRQLDYAKGQFKEALQKLVEGEYIKTNGINIAKLRLSIPEKLSKLHEKV